MNDQQELIEMLEEILDLMSTGMLTDDKVREAYALFTHFKLFWFFGRELVLQEVH